uniref:PP2C family protein-serine/threonine phosphatase n=1 Tax=Actinoplanes sp. RD1 TaxID=3064538 RepID=UPI002740C906
DRAREQSQRETHARRQWQALQQVTARLSGAATVAEVNEVLTRDGPAALAPAEPALGDAAARTLAALGGQALQRAELFENERRAAHQLQRALLPAIMADLPGVSAAARYLPATRGQDVGGDWYDVFALPAGRVGIVVGDVIGHGLTAAVAMGRLQQYVRWIARKGAGPADILGELDELCPSIPGAGYVTVGYAEYDPAAGLLCHARAGHPPPLLVTGGEAAYLWDALSEPLPRAAGRRPQAQIVVAPGTMLVWYSDGLVERRTETLDAGLERLRAAAGTIAGRRPGHWCDCLLETMTSGRPTGDDSVVTCVRLGPARYIGAEAGVPMQAVPTRRKPSRE